MADDFDRFRFCVQDDQGRIRSSHWFVSHARDNLYLGASVLGGRFKVSLHPPGAASDGCDSQVGFTRRYAEQASAEGITNIMRPIRWKRANTPDVGALHVVSIAFPTDFLLVSHAAPEKKQVRFAFPTASSGKATCVDVLLSRRSPETLEDALIHAGFSPVAWIGLPQGDYAIVAGRTVNFAPANIPDWDLVGPQMKALVGAPAPGRTIYGASAIIVGKRPEGNRPLRLIQVSGLSVQRLPQ